MFTSRSRPCVPRGAHVGLARFSRAPSANARERRVLGISPQVPAATGSIKDGVGNLGPGFDPGGTLRGEVPALFGRAVGWHGDCCCLLVYQVSTRMLADVAREDWLAYVGPMSDFGRHTALSCGMIWGYPLVG